MADNDGDTGDLTPGGDDPNPDGSKSGDDQPGAGDEPKLEGVSSEDLVKMVVDLRKESGTYRTRAQAAEGDKGNLTAEKKALEAKIKELEDATKTADEKEAERRAALEERAGRVEELERYKAFMDADYETAHAALDELSEEQKAAAETLLGAFAEDDIPGRMAALRTIKVMAQSGEVMEPGDEQNPGQTGGGANEKSLAAQLSWSQSGTEEAKLAGVIPNE
jgi:hypothetical protein